jgi:UDP-glucuronate decarboxylase
MNKMNKILVEDLKYIFENTENSKFNNSKLLITGCAGFLGFYFMQYFLMYSKELGIKKVIALDSFILGKPEWLVNLSNDFSEILELRTFDISKDNIEEIKDAKNVNYIIHMASIASPSFYRKYPIETIDANIWGLRKLFDYYKESKKVKGFLFFSSSEIYGDPNPSNIPTDENYFGNVSCNGPRSCYDESKRFGETLCYTFSKTFNLPITIARPFNNYGPGMSIEDKRLPADFAKCVLSNKNIEILSDGKPTRTFCYISDAIIGYLKCLLYGKFDYFNIGIDKPEISVSEFAEIYKNAAKDLFKYEISTKFEKSEDLDYLSHNPNRRCPNIEKAKKLLNYNPSILPEIGVMRYLTYLKNENIK